MRQPWRCDVAAESGFASSDGQAGGSGWESGCLGWRTGEFLPLGGPEQARIVILMLLFLLFLFRSTRLSAFVFWAQWIGEIPQTTVRMI